MPDEHTMKAVFIERFTRFIDWPGSSLVDVSADQFVICSLDDNTFVASLDRVYAEQQILARPVRVLENVSLEQLGKCHVLYLTGNDRTVLYETLMYVQGLPILTIGDTQGYAHQGVLINFFYIDNQLRFEINETAMRRAGFNVSYKLLSYAVIVEPLK